MKIFWKIFLNLLLAIFIVILQLAFVNNFPSYFRFLDLILVVLVFVMALSGLTRSLWWAFGIGFVLDIYYFGYFGLNIMNLPLDVIVAYLLLNKVFTNRSLYSFAAVTIFSTIFGRFASNLITYFISLFFGHEFFWPFFHVNFWKNGLAEIAMNFGAVIVLFYFVNNVTRRLQPVFISKRR